MRVCSRMPTCTSMTITQTPTDDVGCSICCDFPSVKTKCIKKSFFDIGMLLILDVRIYQILQEQVLFFCRPLLSCCCCCTCRCCCHSSSARFLCQFLSLRFFFSLLFGVGPSFRFVPPEAAASLSSWVIQVRQGFTS